MAGFRNDKPIAANPGASMRVEGLLKQGNFMKGITGQDAVEDLKVIEAAYESSKHGNRVQIR